MDNIINLLKDPPGWIVMIISGALVAHILRLIFEYTQKVNQLDAAIAAVEIVVTAGLLFAVVHQYYEVSMNKGANIAIVNQPIVLLGVLVIFGIISISLMILRKHLSP